LAEILSKEGKIALITKWVAADRIKNNITPKDDFGITLSCFAHGEFKNMIGELCFTTTGKGAWNELNNDDSGEILDGVIAEMNKIDARPAAHT
jgi:hypothetical protein